MPYKTFSLAKVESKFGLSSREKLLFPDVVPVDVPERLVGWLEWSLQATSLMSEKSRSESIVAPILTAVQRTAPGPLAIFSGQRLDVDESQDLVGECDFIMARAEPIPRLKAPIAIIVEAKRSDISLSLGQCAAQMVAARIFNERDGSERRQMFGCVTTGEDWQFLLLDGNELLFDAKRCYLDNLTRILGVLHTIVR